MLHLKENLITFRDVLMQEPLPLGTVQDAVLAFLRGRDDVAVFGAQAVNVYVSPQRATEDVDVAALNGAGLAEELRVFLNEQFHIATRVREVRGGIGYRVYQKRKEGNRHLVDIRPIEQLPPTQEAGGVPIIVPAELIAMKLMSIRQRGQKAKGLTDQRDLVLLLHRFPDLKTRDGEVRTRLDALNAAPEDIQLWQDWVARELEPEDEDDEFDY